MKNNDVEGQFRTKREAQELSLLWEVSRKLGSSENLDTIGESTLRAMSAMGMKRGILTLVNRKSGEIFIEAAQGISEVQKKRGRYREGEGIIGMVVETGEAMIVPHVAEEPRFLDRTGARKNLGATDIAFVCVPVKVQNDVVGTLSVDRENADEVTLQEDLRLLSIISSMIAQAVRIRRQEEEEKEFSLKERQRLQRERNKSAQPVSTGIPSLDGVIDSLRLGDNVVWQVDDLADYKYFVSLFVQSALRDNRRVVYIRFADHESLVDDEGIVLYRLDPRSGFESFSTEVYNIVTKEGDGVYYVFDCLSNLLSEWATDLMIGNFFVITCPYLFELNTIAYFALIRESHSFKTVARIRETTQLLLDVFTDRHKLYVHPLKVWQRYSPTMFLPHVKEEHAFVPIINSVDAAKLFSELSLRRIEKGELSLDYWDRLFIDAEELLDKPWEAARKEEMIDRICKIMVTRDPRMSMLVKENFSLDDLLKIRERLIGTGYVGGKSVGMLVARRILEKDELFDWHNRLEAHDSFYIGSDVFYTYLVQNGWWRLRMDQKTKGGYFEKAQVLREKMKTGIFPDEIKDQFMRMLEYFGQSPIIVRSSSLLEDNFGNAFAGKYDSIFLPNQGSPEERYRKFEEAVRAIYGSTMNVDALAYRLQRGLSEVDEQMALLVQRVSGSHHKHYFFPDMAGVGMSYNIFTWKKDMIPEAGMLRLVFGLGTRAVNRVEGDYPRIVALDAPLQKPHAGMDDTRRFSQREVDVLNLEKNELETISVLNLMGQRLDITLDLIAVRDHEINERIREQGIKDQEAWIITFDELLSRSSYARIMQHMMKKLETIYQYPVDTEFTVNFSGKDEFKINLLQCRPLQTIGKEKRVELPGTIHKDRIFFEVEGNFFGGGISEQMLRVVYVNPKEYTKISLSQKHDIARCIGRLNRRISQKSELPVMLLGPGRWGSTTPSLGVSVRFSDINNISVLGEIAYAMGNLMPELSYGTHFFQDLVETGIFYLAIFPENKEVRFNVHWLDGFANKLEELVPDYVAYRDVIGVYDVGGADLKIMADVVRRKVVCFHR